jgi:hypothetical protein
VKLLIKINDNKPGGQVLCLDYQGLLAGDTDQLFPAIPTILRKERCKPLGILSK